MDDQLYFARTEKGRAELLGSTHALKPRHRQVLFVVGEAIGVGELRAKLPGCQELDAILAQLLLDGYIGQAMPAGQPPVPANASATQPPAPGNDPDPARLNGIASAKGHALAIIRSLVGERSPVYARLDSAHDRGALIEAVGAGKKVIAAVASASQAQAFEAEVLARLENH